MNSTNMSTGEQDEPLSLEELTSELGAATDTSPRELARQSEEFEIGPPEDADLVDE